MSTSLGSLHAPVIPSVASSSSHMDSYDLGTSTDIEYKTVDFGASSISLSSHHNAHTSGHDGGGHGPHISSEHNNNGSHSSDHTINNNDNNNSNNSLVVDGTDSRIDVSTEYPSSYTIPNSRAIADTSPLPIGIIMNPCVKYATTPSSLSLSSLHSTIYHQ